MAKNINEMIEVLKEHDLLLKTSHINHNFIIEDITFDSREIETNSLFLCKGIHFKKQYLQNAIQTGAIAYVSEIDYELEAAAIIVKDIRKAMLTIAAFFFDYPDRKLTTIGVTGTKGKTTTVKFLKSIFDCYLAKQQAKPCGILSSISIYDGISEQEAKLTTPEAIPLYRHLANAVQAGLRYMIIEVSSQALKFDRVNTIEFDMGAFLNIGQDHISEIEHPDMEDYLHSKLKLIEQSKAFILNSKTDYFEQIMAKVKKHTQNYATFSLDDITDTIYAKDIELQDLSIVFTGVCHGHETQYTIHEPGIYNVENALCAIYIAEYFGVDEKSIQEGLANAKVEGRNFVLFSDDQKIIVWISYAHNGLSFEKTYETIHSIYGKIKLLSMFGAPGDKAKTRLHDLSDIGAKNSDVVIFVPDDPGSRSFTDIAAEMTQIASQYPCRIENYATREKGIHRAFEIAEKEDEKILLFFAGKGEDTSDYVNGEYITIETDLSITQRYLAAYNQKNQKI